MRDAELAGLEKFAEGLALFFYIFMFMAFVVALAGSVGSAFLLLILGSCTHVGQAGLVEFVAAQRGRAERPAAAPRTRVEPARRIRRVA